MINSVNKLELSAQKYQTNGNVRDENYKENLLLTFKDFVSFVTDPSSMYFMSTIVLEDKIGGFHITLYQLAYIRGITHPSHKNCK